MSISVGSIESLPSYIAATTSTVLSREQEDGLFRGNALLFTRQIERLGANALAIAHAPSAPAHHDSTATPRAREGRDPHVA